ncbi:ZIP family zinc transporter [Saccharopolyspora lacisalsi]|uniref:ZIP family zinc transporter n=1 Tax=Halosaccharopolyspora lacisalsi TaxID=1000566 RepID=A0A839DSP1_9PSEU|nr:ZIP family metal transporter [Halosaccharopolyspora lacisalsi]MBA8823276.1 ZIP family zinc transporter [Halosaccharopolyspora lacisalsi]
MSGAEGLLVTLVGTNPVVQGLFGGLVIAFLNLLGALAVLVWRNPSPRSMNVALGFAAGIMVAASFTSLILPGIEDGGLLPVLVGIALGALLLSRAESWVPYVHFLVTGRSRSTIADSTEAPGAAQVHESTRAALSPNAVSQPRLTGTIVFIVAITLHNMPEGLSVGVGFGSGNIGNAVALMLAIGIQNIPEGLAVAISARRAGLGNLSYAAVTGARAGLVEIPLAVLGAALVSVVQPLLPYAMGFAAGGMLYVISHEIVPQMHAHERERLATLGLVAGLMLMLSLDVALA